MMRTTPKFLKQESRHIQASAGAIYYGEIAAFILSFFCESAHCQDFIESRPDFQEIFEIDEEAKKVYLRESFSESTQNAKLRDILADFDLIVSEVFRTSVFRILLKYLQYFHLILNN